MGESRPAAGERHSRVLSAGSAEGRSEEASRALLAAVVESSADAMVTATPDGRITTWNPAAERMYGYTVAEALGMHISTLVTPKLAGLTDEIFAAVLAGQRFSNLEAKSVRKDGTSMYVSVTAFPVVDSEGAVLGGTSILRDISEQRRVRAQLARQTAAVKLLQSAAVAANDATTFDQAAGGALAAACQLGRWSAGHAYLVTAGGTAGEGLPEGVWHLDDPELEPLLRPGAARVLPRPGLGGRVLAGREPVVVLDVAAEPDLTWLGPSAICSAAAFPILVGQDVVGVMELYGSARAVADPAALEVMAQVAAQLSRLAERLRAAEALRASEERSRVIVETASDAFIGLDETGRITEWNRQAENLFGWSRAEALGRPLAGTLLPESGRPRFEAALASLQAARGGGVLPGDRREVTMIHREGRELSVEVTFWGMRTGAGLSLNGFLRDVSERNRLLELQSRLASIVQSSDDAIVGMTPDCTITTWNPGAEQVYGYRADEVMGRSVGMLLPIGSADQLSALERVARGDRFQNRESAARRKDGTVLATSLSASPMQDAAGSITGISSIARDITERKRAEQAIEDMNARLSRSVAELERRNQQVVLVNEMADLLQSCLSVEEAYRVIAESLSRLFADESGALCLIASSRNVLEAVAVWGEGPVGENHFPPDACWALRRGRVHVVGGAGTGPACLHTGTPPPAACLCVPMMAQGETLGLLHVRRESSGDDPAGWGISRGQLATVVAENLSLSLGNFRLREALRNQSIRDPLTGLFNRRYAEESLERELRRATRNGSPIGLISLDLDHFKRFNDRYGHETGDAVLRLLSKFVESSVRGGDIACRYGGEEFLLILPEAPLAVAAARATAIRDGVRAVKVPQPVSAGEALTVSLGVAAFPQHGSDVRTLLRVADAALYEAKAEGRDCVVVAVA